VQLAGFEIAGELFETVPLLADEDRDALAFALAVQVHAHFHVDRFAQRQQAGDQLRQRDADILDIDQHVHDEKAADDALFNVLDIDAALGHVRGELRDDPLLVFPQD
jgi:hypothetical protein